MKKILALSILISMVLVSIPATIATDPDCDWCECPDDNNCIYNIVTQAHVVGGSGGDNGGSGGSTEGGALEGAPIIKCKWEYDLDVLLDPAEECCDEYCLYHDACPFMTGLQVKVDPAEVVQVGYYAIVTDPQGPDHVDHVYADIWHPDGQFKYQIELNVVGFDSAGVYNKGEALDYWNHVRGSHHNLIAYSDFETIPGYTQDEDILYELEQEEAYLYWNWAHLSYCQPGGYYCVGVKAIDGLDMWSDYLFNKYWYIPTAAARIDFKLVNYGDVVESTWGPVGGDKSMDTPGLPTVKNVGNVPIHFKVLQDDMDFGETDGEWNVEYKARLSDEGIWTDAYKPDIETRIPGYLALCKEEKFDFKIHVIKGFTGLPPTTGTMRICAFIEGSGWITPLDFVGDAPYYIEQDNDDCACIIIE